MISNHAARACIISSALSAIRAMLEHTDPLWGTISRELDQIAEVALLRFRLGEAENEEVVQAVRVRVFDAVRSDETLGRRLATAALRQSYLRSALRFTAMEEVRRRIRDRGRKASETERLDACAPDRGNELTFERFVAEIRSLVSDQPKALLALSLLLEEQTIDEYAQETGVAIEVAKRHFNLGTRILAAQLRDPQAR